MSLEHGRPTDQKAGASKRRTIRLWPDAGEQLGLSRNGTYEAARRGEIAGLMRFGKKWVVAVEPFERSLTGK
jgi:hypothetical protein